MKRSNQGQFDKARKMMPDFDKAPGSGSSKAKGNVMDKTNPKALRLANGGSARQPRNGGMKFVKRDMGGMIGDPMRPAVDPVAKVRNPPALGIGMGRPGKGLIGEAGIGGAQGALDAARQRSMGRMAQPSPMMPAVMSPEQQPMGGDMGGFKRGGKVVPRNKAARHSMKENAADKRADAISARKRGMKPSAFEGTKADEKMDRAGSPPMRFGGKPIKRAMGGVGKIRHEAATSAGKPKAAPKGKKLFEAI